jgi:NADP-dependent 3-hydroxy acid dehydrogenase YdfG
MELSGKVAIVTGASSGIGEATCVAFARLGIKVVASARRFDRLEALASRIKAEGGECLPVQNDIAQESQANELVQKTLDAYGRIDILVNNAGVMLLGPVDGANTEEWRRMFDVNVFGLMYATHAALPHMKKLGAGHIVNVSSVAGRFTSPVAAVYSATKFAVEAFSEGVRKQESKNGIRITAVEPGAVATELTDHIGHPETKQMIVDWIAGMRPLQSEDIAASIVYAVSQPQHVNVNQILIRPTDQEN